MRAQTMIASVTATSSHETGLRIAESVQPTPNGMFVTTHAIRQALSRPTAVMRVSVEVLRSRCVVGQAIVTSPPAEPALAG
jgi:hypothetical protein